MTTTDSGVGIEEDVVLGKAGEGDLLGTIFHPPAGVKSKRTAVIHLYGGQTGNRTQASDVATRLAERGYLGIGCWFRIGPDGPWPMPLEDTKTAIRWARANAARLGIDAEKIALGGYSYGAQVALVAAGTANDPEHEGNGGHPGVSSAVAACMVYYMATPRPENFGGGVSFDGLRYLSPSFPPTILIHSTIDGLTPFYNSVNFFQALREKGVPAELHLFEGLSHVFDRHPEFAAACAELDDLFLDRHVADPREYPAFVAGRRAPINTPAPEAPR